MRFDKVEKFNKQTLVYGVKDITMIEENSVNMFSHNKIKCLVQFYMHYYNSECLIEYDISGLKPIIETFKRIIVTRKMLCDVINSAFEVVDYAYEYLLNPEKLVWDIEYVYYDEVYNKCRIIYVPTQEDHSEHNSLLIFIYQLFKFVKVDARDVELERLIKTLIKEIEKKTIVSPERIKRKLDSLVSQKVNTSNNSFGEEVDTIGLSNENQGLMKPADGILNSEVPIYSEVPIESEAADNAISDKNMIPESYMGINVPGEDFDCPSRFEPDTAVKDHKDKKQGKKLFEKKEKKEKKQKAEEKQTTKKSIFGLKKKKNIKTQPEYAQAEPEIVSTPDSRNEFVENNHFNNKKSNGNSREELKVDPYESNETVLLGRDLYNEEEILEVLEFNTPKKNIQIKEAPLMEEESETVIDQSLMEIDNQDDGATVFDDSSITGMLVDISTSETIPIDVEKFLIGRSSDCNLILTNRKVSHHHAMIELIDSSFYITDTGSLNHIFINGVKQQENTRILLEDGDEIKISEYNYKLITG